MDAGYFTMDEAWEEEPTGRRMHGLAAGLMIETRFEGFQ